MKKKIRVLNFILILFRMKYRFVIKSEEERLFGENFKIVDLKQLMKTN